MTCGDQRGVLERRVQDAVRGGSRINPSNLGCDFWAADLDNESFNSSLGHLERRRRAAVLARRREQQRLSGQRLGDQEQSRALARTVTEQVVFSTQVVPRGTKRIDLPQREVDGAQGQNGSYTANSGSGTFVSPHAYHVMTTGPVVIYQFNPIIQQFSNDASTLIPIPALGTDYIAMGFQTANPVRDRGTLAAVDSRITDRSRSSRRSTNTTVTVTASHPIMKSGGDSGFPIAATPRGGTLTFTAGPLHGRQPRDRATHRLDRRLHQRRCRRRSHRHVHQGRQADRGVHRERAWHRLRRCGQRRVPAGLGRHGPTTSAAPSTSRSSCSR